MQRLVFAVLLMAGALAQGGTTREAWIREAAQAQGLKAFMVDAPVLRVRVSPRGGLSEALQSLPSGWASRREGQVLLVAPESRLEALRRFVFNRYPQLKPVPQAAPPRGGSALYLYLKGSQVIRQERRELPPSALRLEEVVYREGQGGWQLSLSPLGPSCLRLSQPICLFNPQPGDSGQLTLEGRSFRYRVESGPEPLVRLVWLR